MIAGLKSIKLFLARVSDITCKHVHFVAVTNICMSLNTYMSQRNSHIIEFQLKTNWRRQRWRVFVSNLKVELWSLFVLQYFKNYLDLSLIMLWTITVAVWKTKSLVCGNTCTYYRSMVSQRVRAHLCDDRKLSARKKRIFFLTPKMVALAN